MYINLGFDIQFNPRYWKICVHNFKLTDSVRPEHIYSLWFGPFAFTLLIKK